MCSAHRLNDQDGKLNTFAKKQYREAMDLIQSHSLDDTKPRMRRYNRLVNTLNIAHTIGVDFKENLTHQYNPNKQPEMKRDHCLPNRANTGHYELENGDVHVFSTVDDGLWGEKYISPSSHVRIATDGSTTPNSTRNSGSALVVADARMICGNNPPDSLCPHIEWRIMNNNNYEAEAAAIARTLRAFPITTPIEILIDNLGIIKAIDRMRTAVDTSNTKWHRLSARPYLRMIMEAIKARESKGKLGKDQTLLTHIHSHTNALDANSKANDLADGHAKTAEKNIGNKYRDTDRDLIMKYEMPFVVTIGDQSEVATGDIRKSIAKAGRLWMVNKWKSRSKAGDILRCHPKETLTFANEVKRSKNSAKLRTAILLLTRSLKTKYETYHDEAIM
jgi:hypothetical protein